MLFSVGAPFETIELHHEVSAIIHICTLTIHIPLVTEWFFNIDETTSQCMLAINIITGFPAGPF